MPDPLRTTPTAVLTLPNRPPHAGQTVREAALNDWTASSSSPHAVHAYWEVDSPDGLEDHLHRLSDAGALVGMSDHGTTKSLYAKDPDGIEFEVVWLIPAHLLTGDQGSDDPRPKPLDLAKEKARYGGSTRG